VSRPHEERGATASEAERTEARREDLDEQIRRVVDRMSPPTQAQRDRLALIFSGKATRLGCRAR
jgi:hypothetical protein